MHLLWMFAVAIAPSAFAQGLPSDADELPVPSLKIDRLPPDWSFEGGVQFGYGSTPVWDEYVASWIGMGLRGGAGINFGPGHRLGALVSASVEGPIGVHMSVLLEPMANWDYIAQNGLAVGAGIGPGVLYSQRNETVFAERLVNASGAAAARVGWSQTFSRVGRRLFVYAEPRVRLVTGEEDLKPSVVVVFGSGAGR